MEEIQMILIYDGRCGFCTRFVHFIQQLDRNRTISTVAWQVPGVLEANNLTRNDVKSAAWFLEKDQRFRGAAGINRALSKVTGCGLFWFIYSLPLIQQIEDFVYAWVAQNRKLFRGTKPYCHQENSTCIQ